MRIASFNINGIRAALKRGFSERMEARDCDVIGLQEVRCRPADLPEGAFGDRHVSWAPGSLAGRNGDALLPRTAPAAPRPCARGGRRRRRRRPSFRNGR